MRAKPTAQRECHMTASQGQAWVGARPAHLSRKSSRPPPRKISTLLAPSRSVPETCIVFTAVPDWCRAIASQESPVPSVGGVRACSRLGKGPGPGRPSETHRTAATLLQPRARTRARGLAGTSQAAISVPVRNTKTDRRSGEILGRCCVKRIKTSLEVIMIFGG